MPNFALVPFLGDETYPIPGIEIASLGSAHDAARTGADQGRARGIWAVCTMRRNEQGQVVLIVGLLIPMLLALGAFVIGIGNWYVHAKHLQTKADASALGGGSAWSFPCSVRHGPSRSRDRRDSYRGPTHEGRR